MGKDLGLERVFEQYSIVNLLQFFRAACLQNTSVQLLLEIINLQCITSQQDF